MENCYCGSGKQYEDCCGRFHSGKLNATTATALMRSRYAAFACGAVDYILKTEKLKTPNQKQDLEAWCTVTKWKKLEIIDASHGNETDKTGTVTFIAFYEEQEVLHQLKETSNFVKEEGKWFYIGGNAEFKEVRDPQLKQVGRNDPCPCNSGKKYKKCCGK